MRVATLHSIWGGEEKRRRALGVKVGWNNFPSWKRAAAAAEGAVMCGLGGRGALSGGDRADSDERPSPYRAAAFITGPDVPPPPHIPTPPPYPLT